MMRFSLANVGPGRWVDVAAIDVFGKPVKR